MAQAKSFRLVIDDLRGGRNGYDPPTALPDNQCVDAVNVDWRGGACVAKKRRGTATLTTTGKTGTLPAEYMCRHVPGNSEAAAELWIVSDFAGTPTLERLAGGTAWANISLIDTWNPSTQANACSFNGKLFWAGDSAANYLHVWDGTSFRRVGITKPAAPTVDDSAVGGAYGAVERYYKVAYTVQVSGTTVRRSELSAASTAFTPDGAHDSAVITKPAATSPTCGETHWEIYGSIDDTTYSLLGTVAVGTTTANDTSDPNNYGVDFPTGAPLAGTNAPPPSAKYVIAFNNRLVMAGAWETSGGETTPKNNRVWFTPVLGASDVGDDERVPSSYYLDLNENSGSHITGLAELFGNVYVFMSESLWVLSTTGDADAPFTARKISGVIGAISNRTIVSAEDGSGQPAVYFLAKRGVYRFGVGGLEYIGRPMEDLWAAALASASGGLTNMVVWSHGIYYTDARQLWFWIYDGTSTRDGWVYQVDLGAWSRLDGAITHARASCLFSETVGASMSATLKPYIAGGQIDTLGNTVVKCDTGTTDASAIFAPTITASVTLKPYLLGDAEFQCGVTSPIVVMTASAQTDLQVLYRPDFGEQADVWDVKPVTADGSETRKRLVFEGLQTSGVYAVQPIISNTDVDGAGWTIDRVVIRYTREDAAP
ncbi:MAG TPA: hypothetical protein VMY35_04805 [Phycisphaerae bacterium]|nr:hypothetical protein [Phycisphaerae bacterium]